jgi:hypothetical protein
MTSDEKISSGSEPAPASAEAAPDQVGYRRPPRETRFKPGQSGNARGRPRGVRNHKQTVTMVACERHWVREGEQRCRWSTLELVLLALRTLALEGNVRAHRVYHDYLRRFGGQALVQGGGFLLAPPEMSTEEWSAQYSKTSAKQQEFLRQKAREDATED